MHKFPIAAILINLITSLPAIAAEDTQGDTIVTWHETLNDEEEVWSNHIYEDSWSTQHRDLALADYTDKHGYLKLHGKLKGYKPSFVHLFRITCNNEAQNFSLIVLGSLHFLDLSLLPGKVKEILLSGRGLVVEDHNVGLFNRKRMANIGMITQEDWIDDFNIREKNHYNICVQDMFERYKISDVSPEELAPYYALIIYFQSAHFGMDTQLVDHYLHAPLLKLEEFEESEKLTKTIFGPEAAYLKTLKTSISRHLSHGGASNSPNELYCSELYLNAPLIDLDCVQDDAVVLRNHKWMPRFMEHLKKYPQGLVAVFGAAHLYGAEGILSLFAQLSCMIEHATIEGEWVPSYIPEQSDSTS